MRGILSSTPSPGPIRLLIGSQILLLIQAGLMLCSEQWRPGAPASVLHAVLLVGIVSLVVSIVGEPRDRAPSQQRLLPFTEPRRSR